MIVFRHGVSDFKNLRMECEGLATGTALASVSTLLNAVIDALKRRNPAKLKIEENQDIHIRCEYNQHTAEIMMVAICGFEWLKKQFPDDIKVERLSSRKVAECETSETRKPKSC